MEEDEWLQETRCVVCGAEIVPGRDRAFALGDSAAMCFACALARGGGYDEALDRWVQAPKLDAYTISTLSADSP